MNLSAVFSPTPIDLFLVEYFGSQPLEAAGDPARFALLGDLAAAEAASHAFERELETPVRVAPAGESREARRPEYDLIAIQVSGATAWQLYGCEEAASEGPIRAVSLQPGGALYLPRAFWHTVEGSTAEWGCWAFEVRNPTGADFVAWMAEKVKENEVFQRDLPRFASPGEQAAHLARLRRIFAHAFRAPSLLQRYQNRLNRLAPAHAVAGAPTSGDRIALATPRRPTIYRTDSETIQIFVGGKEIRYPEDAAPLLQYIIDQQPASEAEFRCQFQDDFEADELDSFLDALRRDGVIAPLQPESALE